MQELDRLQLLILDEASSFPVPVWELTQPTRWNFVDDEGAETARLDEDPPDRESIHVAVTTLLGRGLLEIVHVEGLEPMRRLPRAQWDHLLADDDTWRPELRSPVCVLTTETAEPLLDAVFAAG